MQRRRVLVGLTAGLSLLAGCNSANGGANNSTGNDSTGNNASQSTSDSNTTTGDSATATTVATTMAETAQQTATQTQIQTQTRTQIRTQTQTATTIPTPTRTATTTPTTMRTATSQPTAGGTTAGTTGTATGSMDIDLSNRETYRSSSYPYTIEYPAGWQVDETDPTEVSFTSRSTPSELTVYLAEGAPSSVTLEQVTAQFLRGYQQSAGESGLENEVLDRREVTLPNDHSAIVLDLRLSAAESAVHVRQGAVLTLVGDTVYTAAITIPEMAYSSAVDQQVEDTLLSLTVSGGSGSTVSV